MFDMSASSSFISSRFMHALGLEPTDSNTFLSIYAPLRVRTMPSRVCKGCALTICGTVFSFDLVVLDIQLLTLSLKR